MTVNRAPRRGAIAGLALVLAGLLACDNNAGATRDSTVSSQPTGAAKTFRVALLTPGPISDRSWNGVLGFLNQAHDRAELLRLGAAFRQGLHLTSKSTSRVTGFPPGSVALIAR